MKLPAPIQALLSPLRHLTVATTIFVCSSAPAPVCSAQTFDETVRAIVAANPELRSAALNSDADLQDLTAENRLPDPSFDFEHQWGTPAVGNKWNFSLTQSFDWPGVYAARRSALRLARSAAAQQTRSRLLEKSLEVRLLLIDLVAARQGMALLRGVAGRLDTIHRHACNGIDCGELTRIDANKIAVERAGVQRRLRSLEADSITCLQTLSAISGGVDCAPLVAAVDVWPVQPLLDEEEYERLITMHDPAAASLSLQSQAAREMSVAARRSSLPGFTLGYSFEHEPAGSYNGLVAGITLPVWSSRSRTRAARLRAEALQTDVSASLAETLTEMRGLLSCARSMEQEIEAWRAAVPVDASLTLLRKALDAGEFTIIQYLQEVNYFMLAELDRIDLEHQYHTTVARLNRLNVD